MIDNKLVKEQLKKHFDGLRIYFKEVNNIGTSYASMHTFLMDNYEYDNNLLYYRLTHTIVPELEKEGILTRYKHEGSFFFVINNKEVSAP
jgi:hypothetical protein